MSEVFISYKNSDSDGKPTADALIAQKLYTCLLERGVTTFFSNVSLMEFGEAAYKQAIERALDEADVFVLIATKAEYIESRWVKYEWNSFHEEILSGDKEEGTIVPYLGSSIERRSRPLALRNFETFLTDCDSPEKVADFVMSILSRIEAAKPKLQLPKDDKTHSSYNPAEHKEHNRLKIQARNTKPADMPALSYVFEKLGGKKANVLDVGCAYGYVTTDRFSGIENVEVYGVDRQQECIDFAAANAPAHFHYFCADIEKPEFVDTVEAYAEEQGFEKFDLIVATLVIHHLTDPIKALRNLRKLLSDDGFIIVRGSDDGSVIAYNDNGLVQKIIDRHLATPGISDRLNGRKIYYQLYTSGYKHIKMFNYVKEISSLDFDERMEVFDERFKYRRNYLANMLKIEPNNMEYRNQLEWMDYALSALEDLFGNDSFWYQEVDFVAVARKK